MAVAAASRAASRSSPTPTTARRTITVGSKNFTEQIVLGEIYAQALEAAGYKVEKKLNLGSELIAMKALENGEISGYPEYVSTALTSFFGVAARSRSRATRSREPTRPRRNSPRKG